jgi:DNA-binding NtrC family response regulator
MRTSGTAPGIEARAIAIVTRDESALPDVEQFLAPAFQTHVLPSSDQIPPLLTQAALDAIILDIDTVGASLEDGLAVLGELRQMSEALVLVALTRSHHRAVRLKAGEAGADEFFVAPVDFQELRMVLERALEKRSMEIENLRMREQIVRKYSFLDMIGGSEPMQRVYDAVSRVADANTTVIIRGESGTGKELVARALVLMSPRAERPFISVNCAALPESLIETELFGHEKGAFTGAVAARAGHIELAHTGTLFLDEIATLPLPLQTKLLRVLEERTVTRIGGKAGKKIDFRLITATNENLEEMVKGGKFREDLYYRIHVVPIFVPPLRERKEDIALLVEHFMRVYCAANRIPPKRVEPDAMEVLEGNPWNGNVRELENLVQRLALMVRGNTVTLRDLPPQVLSASTATQESLLIPEEGLDFDEEMARIEAAYLRAALRRCEGKKVAAARLLRVDRQRIQYLCRKHGIRSDE